MNRENVYNFTPGPSTLPEDVLLQAKEELLNWQNMGASVMEISHRSAAFMALAESTEADLRALMDIPSDYKVLFLQGGGRSQFSMVPLNLLGEKKQADYVDTGVWSHMALKEAMRYGQINIVASSASQNYQVIPDISEWQCNANAAYLHYVDNETINGTEFSFVPQVGDVPLVSDMSSNILSRVIDVRAFKLIYAAAQKNIGIAGLTIVILHESLLNQASAQTPMMFNYTSHANAHSLFNTAPTFAWYITSLMLTWLKKQGGVSAIEKINARKSSKLYHYLDHSEFYKYEVSAPYRSRMNVVFKLNDRRLEETFLAQAHQAGFIGLKGHPLAGGGIRASLYNALPEKAVDGLIDFMKVFEKQKA